MDEKPQQTMTETMTETTEPKRQEMPTRAQQEKLQNAVKKLLNPDGTNTQMDGYITSTFDYIQNMLDKMANSADREAAAQSIAEDLKSRFEGWANQQKADRETRRQAWQHERAAAFSDPQ